jgi:hypothetical protein
MGRPVANAQPFRSVIALERLAATCELQSNAKPLNVDANAVP